ncbi:MAG: limonene-1,2-epoxide hydrolase family protein [Novosphingobium sp.]
MASDVVYLNASMTETERANAEFVLDYFRQWEGEFDPEAAFAKYFSPNARLRYEAGVQSPVQTDMNSWQIGPGEIIASNKLYVDMGYTAKAVIQSVLARGPLVVVERIDMCKIPGAPDRAVWMIGVFMLVNGKIVEWTDYYGKRTATGQGTD